MGKETWRVFLALDLPLPVIERIGEIQSRFRSDWPHFRWVSPRNIHLTLHFLGDTPRHKIRQLEGLGTLPSLQEAVSLRLGQLGVFPRWSDPRVLWLSVEGDLAPLIRLHKETGGFIRSLGLSSENRPFSPHITLARIPPQRLGSQANPEGLKDYALSGEYGFFLPSLTLYRSELTPGGPVYTPCFSCKLKEKS